MLSFIEGNLENATVSDLKQCFKELEITHSFPRRSNYLDIVKKYKEVFDFPWREDQKEVITNFLKFEKRIYIVHAVFGSGKTTLLLGMLMHGIVHRLFLPSNVMFVSFNISIKNEIKRKLGKYGVASKVVVRTFDSIIYQICKHTDYPHLDLPNFDGKRRHVYNKIFDKECTYQIDYQPHIIFIDECQDLEKTTMDVFKRFFPNSRFVLAGDIFQSIQKEPRESVLWHYMNKDEEEIYKIYMSETPRVPEKNLNTLKKALSSYYPEFSERINNWKSSNKVSDADIEWRSLETYSQIFEELQDFCREHNADETMILTFSSAITVKGAMGDIARFRRFLEGHDIHVNKNHKRMEENDYFLTTANSSKGLERDYVIVFLTFPLEKAFINLSDDIVVNLITVALTRAKKKVIMYVPKYEDKFSRVLKIFDACPKPSKKIRKDDKSLNEFEMCDYLSLEHTVTELIRQSIIRYDTRIKLKENVKIFKFEKLFENNIPINLTIVTEEEKAFVGVLIENLITSTWSGIWPQISDRHVDGNPMFNHCSGKIKSLMTMYKYYCKQNLSNVDIQFKGIFCYSQLQMAVTNKIIFTMTDDNKNKLLSYWYNLKPKTFGLKPSEGKVKIQNNMKMRYLSGVADALVIHKQVENDKNEEITVIEIKASQDREWKDDALIQAMCYALMSGKMWSRIILLNPFMNEKVSYYFNSKKILTLRNEVFQDIMIFNANCMFAKKMDTMSKNPKLQVEDNLFLDFEKDDNDEITQVSLLRMVSPIKCEVLLNRYVKKDMEEEKKIERSVIPRRMKFRYESEHTLHDIREELRTIVSNPLLNNERIVKVYCKEFTDLIPYDIQQVINIEDTIDDENISEVEKNARCIMRDIEEYDCLCKCIVYMSRVFQMYSFY